MSLRVAVGGVYLVTGIGGTIVTRTITATQCAPKLRVGNSRRGASRHNQRNKAAERLMDVPTSCPPFL